ncbi:MAG: ribosome maturation factor RimM [Acetobacteraceae bacterium]
MREARILLGVIGRPHGVRGLVRVTSYADPPEAIAGYGPLSDDAGRRFVLRWRGDGVAELAEIVDGAGAKVADRDAAARLTNTRLYIERERLPAPAEGEFYLADLVGLAAVDAAGAPVGIVAAVHDYGAGASLEIEREGGPLVVPFTRTAVPLVDVEAGVLTIEPPVSVGAPLPLTPSRKGRGDSRTQSPLPLREGVGGGVGPRTSPR